MLPPNKQHPVLKLLPLVGCCLFVFLYVTATLYYPGGSSFNRSAAGFSWMQNYWCNLMDAQALNGTPNAARPIAIAAMFVLGASLIFFWYLFPTYAGFSKVSHSIMQLSGLLSMATLVGLFSGSHDFTINIASGFGLIAIIGTLAGLKRLKWRWLFGLGLFNLALVAVNNILYYNIGWQQYLPVVQKITFLFFLTWFSYISLQMFRQTSKM